MKEIKSRTTLGRSAVAFIRRTVTRRNERAFYLMIALSLDFTPALFLFIAWL